MESFHERVRTRGECQGGFRPCPFVSCKWHLYLDLKKKGGFKINHPPKDGETVVDVLLRMPDTCALDVADRGPHTLEDVGNRFGLTRERIRQIQEISFRKIRTEEGSSLLEILFCEVEEFDKGDATCYEILLDSW
jgi:hypothetical protein